MAREPITGPWRATRLWNDIVRSFHEGMPLKKHRKGALKSSVVENCFSGQEAVDWMLKHLAHNPNFANGVTKEQTELLLNKILKASLIEPVHMPVGFLALSQGEGKVDLPSFSVQELYRFVPAAVDHLRTPGPKSPSQPRGRQALAPIETNTPKRPASAMAKYATSLSLGVDAERAADRLPAQQSRSVSNLQAAPEATCLTEKMRKDLNRSYFQSLPPNSLIILDNDETWRQIWTQQLRRQLSPTHVDSLFINVSYIIYNMTKVSAKGVVQLGGHLAELDLPHWVLSAMKCLANWPRPLKMLNGQESTLPNYPGFIADVFVVVKDYFHGLGSPLISPDLFDIFMSAFVKAEAIGAKVKRPVPAAYSYSGHPQPSRDFRANYPHSSSTPQNSHFYVMSQPDAFSTHNHERVAKIRHTLEVLPPLGSARSCFSRTSGSFSPPTDLSNFDSSSSMGSYNLSRHSQGMYPPSPCYETVFRHEVPVTRMLGNSHLPRYVPQAETRPTNSQGAAFSRHLRRGSYRASIMSSNWDTRSVATQTSVEEGETQRAAHERLDEKIPRWRRSSRSRKSIAVMEFPSKLTPAGIVNPAFQISPSSQKQEGPRRDSRTRTSSSVDNLLDLEHRASDHIIPSKTVRKEKKKQRERRGRSSSVDRYHPNVERSNGSRQLGHDGTRYHYAATSTTDLRNEAAHPVPTQFITSRFNHLTVKTPMNPIDFPPSDMFQVRAEPYQVSEDTLTAEGIASAIETFKLLALLLPPANRRKLQLLLKFMRRVSVNHDLRLREDKCNHTLALDTFFDAILRPSDPFNQDEELSRKIVLFFMEHYDQIWTPPESLRREIEEKVYESLVSKRLREGEDPYPITFCQRVPSTQYEQEKNQGVQNAMMDLLDQIVDSAKLSEREKRKKLRKFREAYPDVFQKKFPTGESLPPFMRAGESGGAFKKRDHLRASALSKFSSLSRLKNVIRI
eukprot:maker-scaffold168_size293125-snap-gene-0.25 protein:Tk04452 transcript:maker-scaffold168_size293125-snap-gene-0.25-mRNA-1 annotation:"dep domain-containing protein 1a-like"